MAFTAEIFPEHDYIRVVMAGRLEVEAFMRTLQKAVDEAVKQKQCRLLIDTRTVEGNPTVLQRYDAGIFLAEQCRRLAVEEGEAVMRIAIVGRPPVLDPQKLGLTVARNRGALGLTTESPDEARHWLLSDDDSS